MLPKTEEILTKFRELNRKEFIETATDFKPFSGGKEGAYGEFDEIVEIYALMKTLSITLDQQIFFGNYQNSYSTPTEPIKIIRELIENLESHIEVLTAINKKYEGKVLPVIATLNNYVKTIETLYYVFNLQELQTELIKGKQRLTKPLNEVERINNLNNKKQITIVTRQHIADEMHVANLGYQGKQSEPDFLGRIFDLNSLPSRDSRYTNAYDDIYQHTVNNNDWDYNWIYSDPRINMLHCEDSFYLKFLSNTLHPLVRANQEEIPQLLAIYNKHLSLDSFEIVQTDEISGKPIFSGRQIITGQEHLRAKKVEIKKYLNTSYINSKISTMNDAVYKDTDIAIGTAKELLETTCKSILKQRGKSVNSDWTLPQLLKETTTILDFKPNGIQDQEKAEKSIKQMLGGIASIVHGAAELRNSYGTGHGKDADFIGLEIKYAKLLVGVVSEIVIFYLATNGETAELIEL